MKKIAIILGSLVLAGALVGCSKDSTEPVVKPTPQTPEVEKPVNGGIVAGTMEPSVKQSTPEFGENLAFEYTLKNQTEEVQKFTFPSSQEFDYKIYTEKGEQVYHFSTVAMFAQGMKVVEVKPGEELSYNIEVEKLEKGKYIFEVWLTPDTGEAYSKTFNFEVK